MTGLPFALPCSVDELPPAFRLVHAPLAYWARERPQALALCSETQQLTFAALHALVARRAQALAQSPPAVLLAPQLGTISLLIEFLAVIQTGRCAAVGDPAWPQQVLRAVRGSVDALQAPQERVGDLRPFYIGFTSGTSGQPKGFRRHHRSWVESFCAALHDWGDVVCAPMVAPGRMHHSLFLFAALMGLWTGVGAVVQEHFSAERLCVDLAAHPGAVLIAVPSQILMLLAFARRRKWTAPVGLVLISGARWMREHTTQLQQILGSARIIEFYGASETSFIAWMQAQPDAPMQSVGWAFGGVRLCIGESPRESLPVGQAGRIWVESAMHFMDYVHALDGSAALRDGAWLSVRDVGWLDEEGLLHLCGRESRMLVTGGKNLFPEEVEQRLMQHPAVVQASVAGVPDELRGQSVQGVVQFAGATRPSADELARWCRAALEAWKCPRHWWHWSGEWPQTRSGKTDHAAIARAFAAGTQADAAPQRVTPVQPWH